METKYTPGPWAYVSSDRRRSIEANHNSRALLRWREENPHLNQNSFSGVSVATLIQCINGSGEKFGPRDLIDVDEIEANARLIAAAPNLLELLEEVLVETVDAGTYPDGPCLPKSLRDDIKAAINKATGA